MRAVHRVAMLLLWAWLLAWPAAAHAEIPPAPRTFVTDTAGVLSPQVVSSLSQRLANYERASGHQVIVWIGNPATETSIEDFAVKAFEAWKVGSAKADDGIALFIFPEQRKLRIEVGYGLEGQVPDVIADAVIRNHIKPQLARGDFDQAVIVGTSAIVDAIEGKAGSLPPGDGAMRRDAGPRGPPSLLSKIILGVLGALFLLLLVTNPGLALLLLSSFMGRGGGGGFGGGGFGGGGGRSGGGGASGSW